MSRSRRKTPIFGMTSCRSERQDKVIWHGRLRARERDRLRSASPDALASHLPAQERQVSNPWTMGKDGHYFWPRDRQIGVAEIRANIGCRTGAQRRAFKKRFLAKVMAK